MSIFDPAASVRAALIRNNLSWPRRSDRAVLEQVMAETDYCESEGYLSNWEASEWRAAVERYLGEAVQ